MNYLFNNFDNEDYSDKKRKSMLTPRQSFMIRHSGCGSLVNVMENVDGVRFRRSIKFNKKFSELSISNGRCKSIYTLDDNKLIYIQKGKKEIKIVREFFLTHMVMTIECDMAKCRKYFKAVTQGKYPLDK